MENFLSLPVLELVFQCLQTQTISPALSLLRPPDLEQSYITDSPECPACWLKILGLLNLHNILI